MLGCMTAGFTFALLTLVIVFIGIAFAKGAFKKESFISKPKSKEKK